MRSVNTENVKIVKGNLPDTFKQIFLSELLKDIKYIFLYINKI